ncbi:MAG TPA: DUF1844 domain-containing protein [Ignavibacteria bacterium]|nr:DUF1844 domain-containing protein [Ignavibacteria bacterium]HRB01432.1 DUF1844 domain-containing protein [Ignavibacteria bacterium]
MNEDKNTQLFMALVYSLQMQTMIHLGKIQNPGTGEIEENLDAAQATIDMLDMLNEKTKNNRSDDETNFIKNCLSDLKLNFTSEKIKKESESKNISTEEKSQDDDTTATEDNSDSSDQVIEENQAGEAKEVKADSDKTEDEKKD